MIDCLNDQDCDKLEYDPDNLTLKCGGVLIWDFGNFQKVTPNELFKSTNLLEPKKLDGKYISFCKCIFNVKILIYEKATADDILSSWTMINTDLKLRRLVKLFIRDSNNKPVTNAFGISPIRGTLKIGSPRKSTVSAIIDMTSAKRDLFQSNDSAFFSFSSLCMICY